MSRRKNVFQEFPGQKDHKVLGVICTICGAEFRGSMTEAVRQCRRHAQKEHPGEGLEYAAVVEPLTYEAEQRMRRQPSGQQLMEHGEANRGKPLIRIGEMEEAQRLRRLARGDR